uniref:YggT family protein n=1 Tax=Florenciella sp. virus SA2 TaxID=3240092 RepID=A0AB39J6D3_9VIRU
METESLSNSIYVIYIIVGYFFKYYILFYILYIVYFLFLQIYKYLCMATINIIEFFKILLKPPSLNVLGLEFTNYFAIIDGFLTLVIGIVYLIIAVAFMVITGLISLPFNYLFALEL